MARRRFRHPGTQAPRLQGAQARNLGPGWLLLSPFCLLKSCPSSQPSCKTTQYNCNNYGYFLLLGYINKYFVSTRPITANWSISHIFSQATKLTPSTVSTSADADPCSHFEGRPGACDTFPQNWPLCRVYSLLLTPVFTVAYIFGSIEKEISGQE